MYISFILKDLTFILITAFGYHKRMFCKTSVRSYNEFFSISLNWNTLHSWLAYVTYRFDCILLFRNQNQFEVAPSFIQQQVIFLIMIIQLKKKQEKLRKHSIDNLMTVCRYVLIFSHKSTSNYNVLLLVTLRHSYVINKIHFY